jgi:hypothetical protein
MAIPSIKNYLTTPAIYNVLTNRVEAPWVGIAKQREREKII